MNQNRNSLEARVIAAAEAALTARSLVSALDVLAGIGWLEQSSLDAWRRGQIPYLERSISANLHKISDAMHLFRSWAIRRGLKPHETVYVARTRDRRNLRFSKSGDEAIERGYRTYWVSPKLSEAKRQRLHDRESRPPDLVVIQPLKDWTCRHWQPPHHGRRRSPLLDLCRSRSVGLLARWKYGIDQARQEGQPAERGRRSFQPGS